MEALQPITNELLKYVLIALGLLCAYGIERLKIYLDMKMGAQVMQDKMDLILYWKAKATTAVRAAEQFGIIEKWDGAKKLEWVQGWLQSEADKDGIDIDFEQLHKYIEEAVNVMNVELGKDQWWIEFQKGENTEVAEG